MAVETQTHIRGYELRELIGEGGFGAVYRAYQAVVDREVAIKVILPQYANKPDFVRGFETEARLIARLEHPFIVPLFDYWREPDGTYLVMRYFHAGSLKGLLSQQGALPLEHVSQIVTQIGGALDVAHRNHVIHRDIKPENILLDEDGNAFLADFGIAKKVELGKTPTRETSEGFSGSIGYAAPETLDYQPASPRSDIYSLGYVIYEMLNGVHAFADETPVMLLVSHMERAIPTADVIPPAVYAVLLRATAKDPEDRYATAGDLARDFARASSRHTAAVVDMVSESAPVVDVTNPYKGLRPFDEADARDFFGRETLVEQMLEQMQDDSPWHNFLAVVGPSGSGKSSVVHAGLLPALRAGALPGSQDWFIVQMIPGAHPLQQLKIALLSIAIDPSDTITTKLEGGRDGLRQVVDEVLQVKHPILLVIDQFEEVFTLLDDENERRHFLELLVVAVTAADSQLRVIITLRADFYDRPLLYENFGALMQARTQVILPLSSEELERAITGPAKRVGLECDTDLVAAIVSDVREEPGALPLLQYALTEVFEQRESSSLNLAAYQRSGGVLGALARRAEDVYSTLDFNQQIIAKQIFLRLVTPGEGTEDTRRRARYSELTTIKDNRDMLQSVLDTFGKYRLLTFDRDIETREPTIEVAHEALIRGWKRLRRWLDENRHDIRLQRMLAAAAADWRKAGEDDSYLLRGARLGQYEDWALTSGLVLSRDEQAFLKASTAKHQREQALEAERQARELALERRSRQRLQVILGILILMSIAGIALTIFVINQNRIVRQERDVAERHEEEANSAKLSVQAQQALNSGDINLALTLALDAIDIENPPSEVVDTLIDVAYAPGLRRVIEGHHTSAVVAVAISPDGTYGLSVSGEVNQLENTLPPPPGGAPPPPPSDNPAPSRQRGDGNQRPEEAPPVVYSLILWNMQTAEEIQRLQEGDIPFTDVKFLPFGEDGILRAVTASQDGRILLWEVPAGASTELFRLPPADKFTISVSHDGNVLLVMSGMWQVDSTAGLHVVWDLRTGTEVQRMPAHEAGLWFSDMTGDGTRIVSGYVNGTQVIWDAHTGEELHRFRVDAALIRLPNYSMVISPDGENGVTNAGDERGVYIWSIESGESISRLLGGTLNATRLAFNEDGSRLLIMSSDGALRVWDVDAGVTTNNMFDRDATLDSVAFSGDGRVAVTGSRDGTIRFWDIAPTWVYRIQQYEGFRPKRAVFLPGGDQILSFGRAIENNVESSQLILWDTETGAPIRIFGEGHIYIPISLSLSPDGRLALTGTVSRAPGSNPNRGPSRVILWDVQAGTEIRRYEFGQDAIDIAFDPASGTDERPLHALVTHGIEALLFDVETGEILRVFAGGTAQINQVAFSPDGTRVLTESGDGILILWDAETGGEIQRYEVGVRSGFLTFTPDGQTAVTTVGDFEIGFIDLSTGQEIKRLIGHDDTITRFAFSPDGTRGISSSQDNTYILWDLDSEAVIRRHGEHEARVWDAAFSPDGTALLSVAEEAGMILWRADRPTIEEVRNWIADNRFVSEPE